tara:strand:- start:4997 stop:5236 length:240 start_codon:yes stop_codon:yes gene_type:complete
MKKILINNNKDYPFTVYEDKNKTLCHGVEIEGPCKISHKERDGSIWLETEAKVVKLVNIPTENIDFKKIGDIIDITSDE